MEHTDPTKSKIRLSLVLCARNDGYQGNSLWRLNTALNYVAAEAVRLNVASEVELVVVDWGSENRLSGVVELSPAAASMTSFLWVPPDRTRTLQKDSPFAEVLALNAGIRRALGTYVGRLDQDTLVGRRFLRWFFERFVPGKSEVPADGILLSNRRSIPYRFSTLCPSFEAVERFVEGSGATLPLAWPQPEHLYYRSPIGLLVCHRDLWHSCHGYDESLIYFNYMEWDLVLRLKKRHPFVNLGTIVDHDFYHLDHEHPLQRWGASGRRRKMNPVRDETENPPPSFAPNGSDWGLVEEGEIETARVSPTASWTTGGGSGAGASRTEYVFMRFRSNLGRLRDFITLRFLSGAMAIPRLLLRVLPQGAREWALKARGAVELQPLYRWPSILLAYVRETSKARTKREQTPNEAEELT